MCFKVENQCQKSTMVSHLLLTDTMTRDQAVWSRGFCQWDKRCLAKMMRLDWVIKSGPSLLLIRKMVGYFPRMPITYTCSVWTWLNGRCGGREADVLFKNWLPFLLKNIPVCCLPLLTSPLLSPDLKSTWLTQCEIKHYTTLLIWWETIIFTQKAAISH